MWRSPSGTRITGASGSAAATASPCSFQTTGLETIDAPAADAGRVEQRAETGEMARADLDGVRAWRDLDEDLFSGQRQHHGEEESGW